MSASRDGRQIVFGKGNSLFVAAADGSGVRQLLTASGAVFVPRWSSDGESDIRWSSTMSAHLGSVS